MKLSKLKLTELINKIDWVQIHIGAAKNRMAEDKIYVAFVKSSKEVDKVDEVRLRFGRQVLEELNWKPGDQIYIYTHPDYAMLFKLIKVEAGKGFKLQSEPGLASARLHFRWKNDKVPLEYRDSSSVDFQIQKGVVIFAVGEKIEM